MFLGIPEITSLASWRGSDASDLCLERTKL